MLRALLDEDLTDASKLALITLRSIADKRGRAKISMADLGYLLGWSPAKSMRCLHQLIDVGYIIVVYKGGPGVGHSMYAITGIIYERETKEVEV